MQDLDTVLLLLFTVFFSQIILGLAVLPGGESGAPGGAARPNGPPRQRENCTVRKCVASLRCAVKRTKWGQRQTWCLSWTTSEKKSSVMWRNFRLKKYVNIFACGEKVTNSMCGRRKLYIEEVSRTLAVNDVPKMKSCHLPLIFQELWWQIKLPVIKANPVLKRSSIKGVERIKDCCRLRPGQHTIRCQALTRGLQCSLYYLVYIQNFQSNSITLAFE